MPCKSLRVVILSLVVVVVVVVVAGLAGCGEPYREAAVRYHREAQAALIAHGACGGEQDCQKKELLFWAGGRMSIPLIQEGGASLVFYGMNDAAIIEAVVERLRVVQRSEQMPAVELTFYSGPHSAKGEKVSVVFLNGPVKNGA